MNKFIKKSRVLMSFLVAGASIFFHSFGNANIIEKNNTVHNFENKAQNPLLENATFLACKGRCV